MTDKIQENIAAIISDPAKFFTDNSDNKYVREAANLLSIETGSIMNNNKGELILSN
jgi:hypothetical protein